MKFRRTNQSLSAGMSLNHTFCLRNCSLSKNQFQFLLVLAKSSIALAFAARLAHFVETTCGPQSGKAAQCSQNPTIHLDLIRNHLTHNDVAFLWNLKLEWRILNLSIRSSFCLISTIRNSMLLLLISFSLFKGYPKEVGSPVPELPNLLLLLHLQPQSPWCPRPRSRQSRR